VWHVHGAWSTAFVQGGHDYLVPVLPGRPPDGRGLPSRPGAADWPPSAIEVTPAQLAGAEIDVAVAQRPHELELIARWTGRRPGRDLPVAYVEHKAPSGPVGNMRHPAGGRMGHVIVHVSHFNRLFWDSGGTPTVVIEPGVPDPGYRYTGELAAAAVAVNEPLRRGRAAGADLIGEFRRRMRVDLFGAGTEPLGGTDLPHKALLDEMPRRRLYLHPVRWSSLGLPLIEAMHLGMPVVALATTAAPEAVPAAAGVVSADMQVLVRACRELLADPERARQAGLAAREHALARYGLGRFLRAWDRLLSVLARR